MNELKLITLYISEPYLKALEKLVKKKLYPNKAEAIREAIRDLIQMHHWDLKVKN